MYLTNDYSIFNVNKYKTSPIFTWMFLVTVANKADYEDESKAPLSFMATNCKIPGINFEKVETNFAGLKASFPGRINGISGELNITFNENQNLAVSTRLREYSQFIFDHEQLREDEYADGVEFNKKFNKDICIECDLFDSKGDILINYTFYNVFLLSIEDVDISYENKNQVLSKKAKFSYDYYDMTRFNPQEKNKRYPGESRRIKINGGVE